MTHLMSASVKPTFVSIQDLNNYDIHSYSSFESSSSPTEPEMKNEEQETKIRQLNQEIERLSVSNARLKRANRALRMDSDGRVEEKTIELKQATKRLVEQNIQLQRSNRLLKDDSNILKNKLEQMKKEQIWKMAHVGPEYEYLVQMVDVLYRQLLSNEPQCSNTCCQNKNSMMTKEKSMTQSHKLIKHMTSQLATEGSQVEDDVGVSQLISDKETTKHQLKTNVSRELSGDIDEARKSLCYNYSSAKGSLSDLHSFPPVLN